MADGEFALDGGAMFGVVPRPLWERGNPADERNRIDMGLWCLLLRGHGRTVLVDAGIGPKMDAKSRAIYRVDQSKTDLLRSLRALDVPPEAVTDVLLTHLHFDHCGGASGPEGLAFPRARVWVQRQQWEWGQKPSDKDRASYLAENLDPLRDALELLDGPESPFPDLELALFHGHTFGLQAVLIPGDPPLFFPSDLVPMSAHVRLPFVMAYDNQPLVTIEEKKEWLGRAADEGWNVVFQHDPRLPLARVRRGKRDFEVVAS